MRGINGKKTARRTIGWAATAWAGWYLGNHPRLARGLFDHWFLDLVALVLLAGFVLLVLLAHRHRYAGWTTAFLIIGIAIGVAAFWLVPVLSRAVGASLWTMVAVLVVVAVTWYVTAMDKCTENGSGSSRSWHLRVSSPWKIVRNNPTP